MRKLLYIFAGIHTCSIDALFATQGGLPAFKDP
jgi:hypothetical protein